MDKDNPYDPASSTPFTASLTDIAKARYGQDVFNVWHERNTRDSYNSISDWVTMEAGKAYWMEGTHYDWGWSDYFNVGVEYKMASPPANHPQMTKAAQTFEIVNPGK